MTPPKSGNEKMKRSVLMIAYACDPKGIGEYWLGWGWAEQAARAYRVDLITTLHCRESVLERAKACGIRVHFVGMPPWIRTLTGCFGGGGALIQRFIWQNRAARLAERLHEESKFDLVHQTTFHTFRVPFACSRLDIPSVWGPIAGGESIPRGFIRYVHGGRLAESSRRLINPLWLHFPPVARSLRRASAIFVSNHTTLNFLPERIRGKCIVVPPNALRPEDEDLRPRAPKTRLPDAPLHLLYIGYCVPSRALPLVFEALIRSGLKNYRLTVLGEGPALPSWKRMADRLGLTGPVEFKGKVPRGELSAYYASADALVFPGLRDSGGSSLLESMSRDLPVICMDWAGPGEMVDEQSGIKIDVDDPDRAVKSLGEAFLRLQQNPGLGASLAGAARERARTHFSWEEKFRLLAETYERLLNRGEPEMRGLNQRTPG
jgi:glycosyltransferase involved in cell wall biosynthesis